MIWIFLIQHLIFFLLHHQVVHAAESTCDRITEDVKLAKENLEHFFGPVSRDQGPLTTDEYVVYMCRVAECKSMDELLSVMVPSNETFLRDLARTRYNMLAASIRFGGGIEKYARRFEIFSEIKEALISSGFPNLPLKAKPKAIKKFLDPLVKELNPHFVSLLTEHGIKLDPFFVDDDNVMAFSRALTEVSSYDDLANRFGWNPHTTTIILSGFSASFDTEKYVVNLINVWKVLDETGFFNFNHLTSFTVEDKMPLCDDVGKILYASKESIAYALATFDYEHLNSEATAVYGLGEYLHIDVQKKEDWVNLVCWVVEQNSLQDIQKGLELPTNLTETIVFVVEKYIYHHGYSEGVGFMTNVAQILFPAMLKSGYPNFPLNITYGEALSTLEALYNNIGADFPNYLEFSNYEPTQLGVLHDLKGAARAIVDANSMYNIEVWLGIPENKLHDALRRYREFIWDDYDIPRLLKAAKAGVSTLKKLELMGLIY